MGMGDKLNVEVASWGALGVAIVVISIVLLQIKNQNPGNMTCRGGYTFNESANNCYLTTNSSVTEAIQGTGSFVDTVVAGLSEPQNWVAIVIIGVIGFALLKMFRK